MAPRADSKILFDPQGVVWTPVSKQLARKRILECLISAAVLLIGSITLGIGLEGWWAWLPTALVLAFAGWLLWLIPRQVGAIGFAERADDLLIRRGVMFRSLVVVPYGRMQFVDVEAGPLDRSFGIASLQLHTASAHTDASIPGLEPDLAARLRDRLAARGEADLAGL